MRRWLPAVAAMALGCSGAARADWMEASSPHFVVYADESPSQIQRFAQQLEVYHKALELLTGVTLQAPSPSNRLTVFVVRNTGQVQRLYGGHNPFLAGFFLPRAGDSIAVVPSVQDSHDVSGEQDFSMVTLLHEYTHFFVISTSSLPSPRWLGEGAAEFFSSAGFPASGGIEIGMPAYHRAGELFGAQNVTVQQLLDPAYDANGSHLGVDAFYGKSWLLYHYLTLGGTRRGQMAKYIGLLAKGEGSLQAGHDAFGDFKQLDRELDKYLNQSKMSDFVFAADKLPIGAVTVRRLSDGEQDIMPDVIRTRVGETADMAKAVIDDVQKAVAKYPKNAAVLTEFAEAQCDAGNNDAAVAAADAALALDPKLTRAYYQKGRALFVKAKEAPDKETAYKQAIAPFLALNKLENDDPLPLTYYYRSFVERGATPSPVAADGLARAAELAPYDLGLRLELAEYEIGTKDYTSARSNLVPIAFYPESNPLSAGARTLIERIDGGKPPTSQEAALIMKDAEKAATGKGGKA
jgi:tetratricopeptide (TPR) repeat protein